MTPITRPTTTTPRLSNLSRCGVLMVVSAAAFAGVEAAPDNGETVVGVAPGAAAVAPAAAGGDDAASAAPICWLAWLTAGLLGCRGVTFSWLFWGGRRRFCFGGRLLEVVGDQRS